MVDAKQVDLYLKKNHGIVKYVGVSDSTLSPLIDYLTRQGEYKPFANEGDAVAYAVACTLAGLPTAVLMQNSGLTNASSPITSLSALYKVPMVYIVGWRGCPEDEKVDEPQHRIVGTKTKSFILSMSVGDELKSESTEIGEKVSTDELQTFYLIRRGSLIKDDGEKSSDACDVLGINRSNCISKILETINSPANKNHKFAIVTTTGYTGRELMKLTSKEDENRNFYILGSMGCAISFARGLAESLSDELTVILLDGDGSFFMRPSGYIDLNNDFPSNLVSIIFDNKSHLSTGGQEFRSRCLSYSVPRNLIESVIDTCSSGRVFKVTDYDGIPRALQSFLEQQYCGRSRSSFILVDASKEFDDNLPRPTKTPEQIAEDFVRYISSTDT